MPTATELPINTAATATDMATTIFGNGVQVNSATYTGDQLSSGTYSDGDAVSPEATPGDTGVILSTGYVTDFTNSDGTTNTNQAAGTSTNTAGVDGDADFEAIAPSSTFDASFLEVNFTPQGDFITIDFVLSSEEYPEYANSQFNDVVGVWVNGVQATVTVGDGNASIGNINGNTTQNLYQDNTADQFNTEMDGFTITLTFVAPVIPNQPNTLKIGVADVADNSYDTNLLIAGGSVQSTIVAQDDAVVLGNDDTKVIDVLNNDSSTGGALTITHIQGTPVVANQQVTLSTGQVITLNADGTLTVDGDSDAETIYFNYTVEDQNGATDTALVEVEQVPCFVLGTLIDTPDGPRPIETLRAGDLILTADDGPQPVRWIGRKAVAAKGMHRPVRLHRGAHGATRDLWLSQQHQVVLTGYLPQLLFGEDEVLTKAKTLVNGHDVVMEDRWDVVTYLHLLFDRHQIVQANGVACESYLPGPMTMGGFDPETRAEIAGLFPEINDQGIGYGPAARTMIKGFEARALMAA
ncbi:choice-of-anchor L domain-containing protein [uncultured Tateyamaria sp.]|uniref:choice-of-anchor L domain-containing protein n=1 Tax=uncultured Tateyamaria sp. TaxID=455651 RepID=UPI002619F870|nr:choice-of-anchor L domain-containing protein [uncultured Tateyamaria sp.]